MPPRPQFSQPQRSFLAMEFHRRRGTRDFIPGLLADFAAQFPGERVPSAKISNEVAQIDPAMVKRAMMDMKARAVKCIAAGGGNFEK